MTYAQASLLVMGASFCLALVTGWFWFGFPWRHKARDLHRFVRALGLISVLVFAVALATFALGTAGFFVSLAEGNRFQGGPGADSIVIALLIAASAANLAIEVSDLDAGMQAQAFGLSVLVSVVLMGAAISALSA